MYEIPFIERGMNLPNSDQGQFCFIYSVLILNEFHDWFTTGLYLILNKEF